MSTCNRRGCPHETSHLIMGDCLYICPGCYQELIEARKTWSHSMTREALEYNIIHFIDTCPGSAIPLTGTKLDKEFKRLCPPPP